MLSTGYDRATDHLTHDLRSAAVDSFDARIYPGSSNRILTHVAIAAMKLKARVDGAAFHLRAPNLGHRGSLRAQRTTHVALDAVIDERPPHLDLGRDVREHEACILKIRDSLSEGGPLADVLHGPFEAPFGGGHRGNGDHQSLLRKLGHKILETSIFFAK